MRVVVQVAKDASVNVQQKCVGSITNGLMILVGFTKGDNTEKLRAMAHKVTHLRVFPDASGVMNKSILDIEGSILSVSQFTLYADTTSGNRPSYSKALNSLEAKPLYDAWNELLRKEVHVETGIFGADMEVIFKNIGPTTIIMEN